MSKRKSKTYKDLFAKFLKQQRKTDKAYRKAAEAYLRGL